jgi:hypothetical protein
VRGAASGAALAAASIVASAGAPARAEVPVDRVLVRYWAPETGGAARPRFVFDRELAFEARVEALADPDWHDATAPWAERHVRAALERHVSEEILGQLPLDPEPSPAELARRAVEAREELDARARGPERVIAAAAAEGIGDDELDAMLRREARASIYLDRMVTPVLQPSDAELREVQRAGATPFRGEPFDQVAVPLRRWYVAQRLAAVVAGFFQGARGRIQMLLVPPEG